MAGKPPPLPPSPLHPLPPKSPPITIHPSYDYEPQEPTFDSAPPSPSPPPTSAQTPAGGTLDPDLQTPLTNHTTHTNGTLPNGVGDARTVVEVGEVDGGAGRKNAVVGVREKRVPEGERRTTPFMTKYERARVLGVRALQIRYVDLFCRDLLEEGPGGGLVRVGQRGGGRGEEGGKRGGKTGRGKREEGKGCGIVADVVARRYSMNAPVLVDLEGETDPLLIAIKELREKKIPLVVRRYLPDGW